MVDAVEEVIVLGSNFVDRQEPSFKNELKRTDPCSILPVELLQIVFSHLDIREWTVLRNVSKSWNAYLSNDPYLWANSIDFGVFDKAVCNEVTFKKCLDNVFLDKPGLCRTGVQTIKYLSLSGFASDDAEAKCLEMLRKYNFVYFGKITELKVTTTTNESPLASRLSDLTPVKKLSIHSRTIIYLEDLLSVECEQLDVCVDSIIDTKYDYKTTFPKGESIFRLKSLDVGWSITNNAMRYCQAVCPSLEHYGETFYDGSDVTGLCKIFSDSNLTSLSFNSEDNGRRARLYSEDASTFLQERIPKWPEMLTKLSLQHVYWPGLEIVMGSLQGLEDLDLSGSKLDLCFFFRRFECGKNLKRLILSDFCNDSDDYLEIWPECPNLEKLSLFNVGYEHGDLRELRSVLKHCEKLEDIDFGGDDQHEDDGTVLMSAERGIKRIGCAGIEIAQDMREKIGELNARLIFEKLDM